MISYAIKIDEKYFNNEYVYATQKDVRRYAGNATVMGLLQEGDIIDVILTDEIETTSSRRGLRDTIVTLYTIEKLRNKVITIIPIEK